MDTNQDPLTLAVRELRSAVGESQQAFAYRMKTAIRTIARWETVRPPRGRTLLELAHLSRENQRPDLAEVFRLALSEEVGTEITLFDGPVKPMLVRYEFKPEDRLDVGALWTILYSPELHEQKAEWDRISGPIKAAIEDEENGENGKPAPNGGNDAPR